jgi:UDP-N-acetylglucosamine--dolichyl-phosphate N-acetylglucosaminephosphotransferase
MLNELTQLSLFIVPVLISVLVTFFVSKFLISYLPKHGLVVQDMLKPGKIMIPRPGGPAIIAGIVTGGLTTYAIFPMTEYLVLLLSIGIGFTVGIIDDRKVMKGWFKPVMLIVASIPLLIFVINSGDELSLIGNGVATIPLLYGILILVTMPLIGNTANSLDVYNGVVTNSFIIAFAAVFIAYGLNGATEEGLIGIPIIVTMLVFHYFHKLPTKIFPGDSGAITIGVAYIGFSIITHMEIIAIIAIMPAILNSFIFLSSTKKIVEHRELKGKAVGLTEDYKLKANKEKAAVSIFRLMLVNGPLTERQISRQFYKMMGFSGFIAICITGAVSTTGMFTAPLISFILGVGLILMIYGTNHKRLYIMITITIGLIVCMLVPTIYYLSDFTPLYQFGIISTVFAMFVGALIIMNRKLLKPLYKKLEPN